ncbi:hypothetical protein K2173_009878 [Erythroxylum novogranatense]|uniref:Uncharacterized protein n=1 Tax=Erythroxylum novogranatense TaxID=1862640 RepID=A0AAV8SZ74_9ROSI|nr:hypothetical protein K2173_009878 [Erythroxylum novogranatense]
MDRSCSGEVSVLRSTSLCLGKNEIQMNDSDLIGESEKFGELTLQIAPFLLSVLSSGLIWSSNFDAIMNIPAAPDRFSSHRGSGIPFVNEYPEEKNLARMMTPGGMNSEAEFFIKKEASRMPPAQRDFLASELEDQVLQEELLSLFNEMKYYSSSEDDEQDVDGHPLPKVPVPSISMLVEIRTSLKTVIHGFYLGASVLQDASMLAKLKDSLSYLSQLGPRYGFHFGENVDQSGAEDNVRKRSRENIVK